MCLQNIKERRIRMELLEKLNGMNGESRVWVYQSERFFQENELSFLHYSLTKFMSEWAAHGAALSANYEIVESLFVVLAVDESKVAASGCSIDSSTRFIKSLEKELNLSLTNRLNVACVLDNDLKIYTIEKLKQAIASQDVQSADKYFDNTITKLSDLRNNWIKPLTEGWTNKFFNLTEV